MMVEEGQKRLIYIFKVKLEEAGRSRISTTDFNTFLGIYLYRELQFLFPLSSIYFFMHNRHSA